MLNTSVECKHYLEIELQLVCADERRPNSERLHGLETARRIQANTHAECGSCAAGGQWEGSTLGACEATEEFT